MIKLSVKDLPQDFLVVGAFLLVVILIRIVTFDEVEISDHEKLYRFLDMVSIIAVLAFDVYLIIHYVLHKI